MSKVSVSHEDYLEAIVELGGRPDTPIRSVDVATRMGVSKASVNRAITTLKDGGMLVQPLYGDITLTDEGYAYGTKVLERHRLIFDFLTKCLGIDPEIADDEACKMEHAISDQSFEKWITYLKGLDL